MAVIAPAETPPRPGTRTEAVRRWLARRSGWALTGIGVLVTVAVTLAVLVPIVVIAGGSFWSAPFIRQRGQLTVEHYVSFLTSSGTLRLIPTTLEITLAVAVLAVVVGGGLAWIIARTDIPLKRALTFLPVAPLLLSGLLRDTSWIALFGPRAGIGNRLLAAALGVKGPVFNVYGLAGLIISLGLALAAIPYLILLGPIGSMNPSLEEASRASGASQLRTLRSVTIPLLRPAVMSGFIVAAIIAATAFETPILIGLPGGVNTFIASIYTAMTTSVNFSAASAESMLYLVFIGSLLWWYRRTTRVEGRFALVVGKGQAKTPVPLGAWRYPLLALVLVYFFLSFVQLLGVQIYLSLVPYYTATSPVLPHLSFANYRAALDTQNAWGAIEGSLSVAAEAAAICAAVGLVLGYVSYKSRVRGRRVFELIGTLPLGFPPLVFSVALLITFLSIPGLQKLYNSLTLLLIVLVVVFLPFTLRVLSSALVSIDDQLLEASAASGAGLLRTMRSIIIPLLGTALVNGFGIVFILSFRELGGAALVTPPSQKLMMTQIFQLYDNGNYSAVYALNVLSFLITTASLGLLLLLLRAIRYVGSRGSQRPSDRALIGPPAVSGGGGWAAA
jgi:iron(III) transport system permease protein